MLAGAVSVLSAADFELSWNHSVEHTEWRESWTLDGNELRLVEARVRGSGAGMDPGEGARLENGWWVWAPVTAPVPALYLAASGATGGGWILCGDAGCREVGIHAEQPARIAAC